MSQTSKTQFLACLLALLANYSSLRLVIGLVGLTVGLAIGGAELMSGKVADGFSKYFLLKELMSFFRC